MPLRPDERIEIEHRLGELRAQAGAVWPPRHLDSMLRVITLHLQIDALAVLLHEGRGEQSRPANRLSS
jgi:hypothetical protein